MRTEPHLSSAEGTHLFSTENFCYRPEAFFVWNSGKCWTEGGLGVVLRNFGGWKRVGLLCLSDVLNWGLCGTKGVPNTTDKTEIELITMRVYDNFAFYSHLRDYCSSNGLFSPFLVACSDFRFSHLRQSISNIFAWVNKWPT